jgi:hypothetical protein
MVMGFMVCNRVLTSVSRRGFLIAAVIAIAAYVSVRSEHVHASSATGTRIPVLVELFTSEGCSSCPPADAFLQRLDTQPFPDTQVIVLSEHVDYWNHIGWTDPYSSHAYSERQDDYSRHFKLESVYTPQMIVDGAKEFVGNDPSEAQKVFAQVAKSPKIQIRLTDIRLENGSIHAHVDAEPLSDRTKAEVDFVVALDRAESHVLKGENAGRQLTHVAVVRSISRVGTIDSTRPFSEDVSVKLGKPDEVSNLRLIAFIQRPGPGRVLGATMETLSGKTIPAKPAPPESEPRSSLARASLQ